MPVTGRERSSSQKHSDFLLTEARPLGAALPMRKE